MNCECPQPVYIDAEIVEPAPPPGEVVTLGGLLDTALQALGWRVPTSPLPLAASMFGAPGWFVPVTLVLLAGAGVGGLYATGKLGGKRKKRARR